MAPQAAASKEPLKEKTPRGDWDVFACVRCGGRRRVLAYVNEAGGVRAILEHLGLPTTGARRAPASCLLILYSPGAAGPGRTTASPCAASLPIPLA